jgi:hypothetical protein
MDGRRRGIFLDFLDFLDFWLPYNSRVFPETVVERIRTFGCGYGSARRIGVCTILGREETGGIDKIVVSAFERLPIRVGAVTSCYTGLVAGRLVNAGIHGSRGNRAHQYRHTVVCSCDKRRRPWGKVG